jgi:hypothetical protein
MLLMLWGFRITSCEVEIILRFFPVKVSHSGIGAGSYAHATPDTLVVILKDNPVLFALVCCAHRASPCASRILAMLAAHREIFEGTIGVFTSHRINGIAPVG